MKGGERKCSISLLATECCETFYAMSEFMEVAIRISNSDKIYGLKQCVVLFNYTNYAPSLHQKQLHCTFTLTLAASKAYSRK